MSPKNASNGKNEKVGSKYKDLWKPILLIAVILGITVVAKIFGLGHKLSALRDWIREMGPAGGIAFVFVYILFVIFALPGSIVTVVAGALYGSLWGVVLVSIASTTGAGLAFLISRYFAREAIANWLSKREKFKKLDEMTEKQGGIIVAITRLIPIFPFNLLNYGFGLTRVPFKTYIFWSWLCMLPGTVLYVVGTDVVTRGITSGKVPWPLITIVVVTAVILVLVVRKAQKRLGRSAKSNE